MKEITDKQRKNEFHVCCFVTSEERLEYCRKVFLPKLQVSDKLQVLAETTFADTFLRHCTYCLTVELRCGIVDYQLESDFDRRSGTNAFRRAVPAVFVGRSAWHDFGELGTPIAAVCVTQNKRRISL